MPPDNLYKNLGANKSAEDPSVEETRLTTSIYVRYVTEICGILDKLNALKGEISTLEQELDPILYEETSKEDVECGKKEPDSPQHLMDYINMIDREVNYVNRRMHDMINRTKR